MTRNCIAGLASIVLFFASSCSAKNWTDNSKLLVHIPSHMYKPAGELHYRIPFGNYPRAKTHSNYVYYLNSTLCWDYPPNTLPEGYPTNRPGGPFIMMANGGHCSAVKKTRRAQEFGASALLIAEPNCTCWDDACRKAFPTNLCNNEQTPAVNDGSANDISIPSFIIFKVLGDKLKDQMIKHKEPVMVELQWDLETDLDEGSKPTIHFWTSAYDEQSVRVDDYTDLQVVTDALAKYAAFEPRFMLFNGTDFGCTDTEGCGNLCTNHGRYCTVAAEETKGEERMAETLRRICVFRHFGLEKYWKYVVHHKESCAANKEFGDEKCIEKSLKQAGIHDHGTIEQCFGDSGGLKDDRPNDLLDEALRHIVRAGVMPMPSLSIDHHEIEVSPLSLLESVCSQYWFSRQRDIPKVCETCGACLNTVGCLQHGKCVDFSNKQRYASKAGGKSSHGWRVFGYLLLMSVLGAGAYYAYDKYRDQSSGGVGRSMGGLLNDYMQLGTEE